MIFFSKILPLVILFLTSNCFAIPTEGGNAEKKEVTSKSQECEKKERREKNKILATIGTVDAVALKALLAQDVKMSLVDARSKDYDDGKRLPGALLQVVSYSADEKELRDLFKDKKQIIICYCVGFACSSGKALAVRLKELGYENVIDFPGGIQEWESKNFPTVRGSKKN